MNNNYKRLIYALYMAHTDTMAFVDTMAEVYARQKAIIDDLKSLSARINFDESLYGSLDVLLREADVPIELRAMALSIVSIPEGLLNFHVQHANALKDNPIFCATLTVGQKRWLDMVAGANISNPEVAAAATRIVIDEIGFLARST